MVRKSLRLLRYAAVLTFLVGCGFFVYAMFIEPRSLTVTTVDVELKEWQGTDDRLRVVAAFDFHMRPGEDARLEKIVNRIIELKPGIILLGGDYCNGHTKSSSMPPEEIARGLAPLAKVAPVFAVVGNHDIYQGAHKVRNALEQVGIEFIDHKSFFFSPDGRLQIQLAGVVFGKSWKPAPRRASCDIPMLNLTHSPDVMRFDTDNPSLMIAGHTHGGQVCLPGGTALVSATEMSPQHAYGDFLIDGKRLVVSRGLGMSILPMRLFCPPEIMVLELRGVNTPPSR